MHLGQFVFGDLISCQFSTTRFSTGAPFTLVGSPAASIYKIQSAGSYSVADSAAISVVTNLSGITGLHSVEINTALADASFYSPCDSFQVILTAGTVDGISQAGRVVGSFSIISPDIYHADIHFVRDQSNTRDEYTVVWFKNGVRVSSGITGANLQVIQRADGTDLVDVVAMTQIGTTGAYRYNATAGERQTVGEAVIAIATATIDGSGRSFSKAIGRDSS